MNYILEVGDTLVQNPVKAPSLYKTFLWTYKCCRRAFPCGNSVSAQFSSDPDTGILFLSFYWNFIPDLLLILLTLDSDISPWNFMWSLLHTCQHPFSPRSLVCVVCWSVSAVKEGMRRDWSDAWLLSSQQSWPLFSFKIFIIDETSHLFGNWFHYIFDFIFDNLLSKDVFLLFTY